MNYTKILEEIKEEVAPLIGKGKVANYIPALASVPNNKYGIAITTINGNCYTVGDAEEEFSIQSISKVFTFAMAFKSIGEKLWQRVGKEPSGNPFNSLVQLEKENGIPRNPFINAGALVVTDSLIHNNFNPKKSILDFIRKLSGNQQINYNTEIARSENEYGHRNYALAHFMKSYNNIYSEPDELLDVYFHQCSLSMSCVDLSKAVLFLANHGVVPNTDEIILTTSQAKRTNSLMMTCGMYDASGDFAFRVGIPGKSGVGGGIIAVIPGELGICVWSPELDEFGNSLTGVKTLELFTTKTGVSIF
ncbi:MAG: glutaminase [Melioribacteraceae bacterium]|nr:glutaminase [Melioribacteraceae bacterium]